MNFNTILPGTNNIQHIIKGPETEWNKTNKDTSIIWKPDDNSMYTVTPNTIIKNK